MADSKDSVSAAASILSSHPISGVANLDIVLSRCPSSFRANSAVRGNIFDTEVIYLISVIRVISWPITSLLSSITTLLSSLLYFHHYFIFITTLLSSVLYAHYYCTIITTLLASLPYYDYYSIIITTACVAFVVINNIPWLSPYTKEG